MVYYFNLHLIFISKGEETTFNTLFTKSCGDLRTALIDPRNFYAAPHTYIRAAACAKFERKAGWLPGLLVGCTAYWLLCAFNSMN